MDLCSIDTGRKLNVDTSYVRSIYAQCLQDEVFQPIKYVIFWEEKLTKV